MLSRSLPAVLFALGGALAVGFLMWLLVWKYKILFDPSTRAAFRAGQRPAGFLARGSLLEVISKPSGWLVFLALITSTLFSAGMLFLLCHEIESGGLALLGGGAVFLWALWCVLTRPEDRVRATAAVSQRIFAALDNLVEKPKVTLLLYVIAISLGLLMVADSVVSGRIIGWTVPSKSSNPADFWTAIAFWLGMTGWVGASFVQELRNQLRKREMGRTE